MFDDYGLKDETISNQGAFRPWKAVLDIYVLNKQPHFLGEKVTIGR